MFVLVVCTSATGCETATQSRWTLIRQFAARVACSKCQRETCVCRMTTRPRCRSAKRSCWGANTLGTRHALTTLCLRQCHFDCFAAAGRRRGQGAGQRCRSAASRPGGQASRKRHWRPRSFLINAIMSCLWTCRTTRRPGRVTATRTCLMPTRPLSRCDEPHTASLPGRRRHALHPVAAAPRCLLALVTSS